LTLVGPRIGGPAGRAQTLHFGTEEGAMRSVILDLPVLGFVVGTRAALAAGIALLVSTRLTAARRRRLGLTLIAIGAATTVPAAYSVVRGSRRERDRSLVRGRTVW